MITSYGIYNNHELDNTLLVLFLDLPITKEEELDKEVVALYHQEKIVGYKIKNFIRYAKIKYSGIIFLPIIPLVDVINLILNKYINDKLAYKTSSGYITKYDESHLLRVFALEGTFLRDGTISKGKYCSYYDLFINDDHSLIEIKEDIKENIDFFLTEEKGK